MRRLLAVVIALISCSASAATKYRFSKDAGAPYPSHTSGSVLVDGDRWRADFETAPDQVVWVTAIVSPEPGKAIAINSTNSTWFNSNVEVSFGGSLFTFGVKDDVSKIRVDLSQIEPSVFRIDFSYRIATSMGPAAIGGLVSGQQTIWTRDAGPFPYPSFALHSGIAAVDDAFRSAMTKIAQTPVRTEVHVSRKLDGGNAISTTITQEITDVQPAQANPSDFVVPSAYRHQEPVIAAPGVVHH